jgi:hypothetical protein
VVTSGDVKELQFITPIVNLHSIISKGIMSHEKIGVRSHLSVADREVQARREAKCVPPSQRKLHTFANLYLNARNAMMFRVIKENGVDAMCVVCVDRNVLYHQGVMIADRNAAATSCRFYESPEGRAYVKSDDIFCERWTTNDSEQRMMAEVLVPDGVLPALITSTRVASEAAKAAAVNAMPDWALSVRVTVDSHLFFVANPQ